jgi:hypothetical protein
MAIKAVHITPKTRTSFLIQKRSMFTELEKLLKIFISSFLKSLKVNIKYIVPDRAVMIKKNENNSGGLSPGETFSMFSFSEISG